MPRRSRPRAQQRRLHARTQEAKQREQPGKTWYRMKNFVEAPDTAAIYLYDEIGYWGITAQDFVRDLMGLRVSNIVLHINSPGGEVWDGLAIYHALRDHPATIESRVDGVALSAASFIAMAADTVTMQRNAQMMIHDASGFQFGNAGDMRTMADLLDKSSNNIADIYTQMAGGTVEAWRAVMEAETWYSAEEAVAAGLADRVAGDDEESGESAAVVPGEDEDVDALMQNEWDLSIFTYAGRAAAPAPAMVAEVTDPAPVAPAVEDAPVEPPPVVTEEDKPEIELEAAPESEPEPVEEPPEPAPEPLALGASDPWAALTGGLLTPDREPSTVDELFAALQMKGLPA